jgi:hypothetical protein
MSLPEKLHEILMTLRKCFGTDLPDPSTLPHGDELSVRGKMVTVRSSVPVEKLMREPTLTVYAHSVSDSSEMRSEVLQYFHYEGRKDLAFVYVRLDKKEDGTIQQNIKASTLPKDNVLSMINRAIGQGGARFAPTDME